MLLIFGPTTDDRAASVGGTTILCDQMVDYISRNKIKNINFIKTNKFENRLVNLASIVGSLFIKATKSRVIVVNASDNLMFYFCPLAYFYAKIFGKKIVIRTFGANFETFYKELNILGKILVKKTVLCADIIFSETKHQIYSFYEKNTPVSTSIQCFQTVELIRILRKKIEKTKG